MGEAVKTIPVEAEADVRLYVENRDTAGRKPHDTQKKPDGPN